MLLRYTNQDFSVFLILKTKIKKEKFELVIDLPKKLNREDTLAKPLT